MISAATRDTVTFFTPAECAAYNAANPPPPGQSPPCSPGNWAYRHYIRRPDQREFSFLVGARQDLSKDVISYDFAISRGHNIGGQAFPTTNFRGAPNSSGANDLSQVAFVEDKSDPYRPNLRATDGTNGIDPSSYAVSSSVVYKYHATQLNTQGSASLAHN